ncbi:MAG: bifunctional homocysteine S-methyltransferase/methylenetetrahydrofolate reductase [Phycisphaerae bacterium]|nr:bifunctional homocysteine S-methyltransferase/methylenetetrahydrofolate reductase [Phycisphaerae bacterium]
MDRKVLLDALQSRVVVGDGGILSELHHRGLGPHVSAEGLNLTRPDLVAGVHRDYVQAGATLIETNTRGANRPRLEQYHLADQISEINAAAVRLARNGAGGRAWVAGAVGPLPSDGLADRAMARLAEGAFDIFAEQMAALVEAGVDLLICTPFRDLDELHQALRAAKHVTQLPVIALATFEHHAEPACDVDVYAALQGLADAGADVVGTSSGRGASNVVRIVETFGVQSHTPIAAFPNAGFGEYVGGRLRYTASPEYMAAVAERLVAAGANIVGGCGGTGPTEVAAITARLAGRRPVRRVVRAVASVAAEPVAPPPQDGLLERAARRKGIIVQVDPPAHLGCEEVVRTCRTLAAAGVDAIAMGDSPLTSPQMSNVAMASIVQREVGVDCMVHMTCRDRNRMALQADLMGAWALGVRHVLVVTGNPPASGDMLGAGGVFDVDSVGCIDIVRGLNRGRNVTGASIGWATAFRIGCAFDPSSHLPFELDRLKRKVAAGAAFAATPLVFDAGRFVEGVQAARAAGVTIPIFASVYPLRSHRNAEFIGNELPGARVPSAIVERMTKAGPADAGREGIQIAKEVIEQVWSVADGVYVVTPMRRAEPVVELVNDFHARVRAGSGAMA